MGIRIEKISRQSLILFSMVAMLVGLLCSRSLLSIGMIVFVALTCIHKSFRQQFVRFYTHPFLIGISLLFFIPLISGLWSEDLKAWADIVRIKLPLLFLPIAFAGPWQLSKKQWTILAYVFLVLVFAGCIYSLWNYFGNRHIIDKEYLKAGMISTPLEDDHLRFSWLVAVAVICSALLIKENRNKYLKLTAATLAGFFIVYLHILSARAGLVSFYIFLIFYVLYLSLSLKQAKWIIVLCSAAVFMPVAAWLLFPTFQNRIKYFIYDYSYVYKNTYLPGSNDGTRIMSLKAGWDILKENPLGVGAGDINKLTREWYAEHVPQMRESDKVYPSCEWLVYGGAAGWPGFILFTAIMIVPLFLKNIRERFFWITLNVIAAFSLAVDIGIEVQFGVFIYVFVVLWWWRWLSTGFRNLGENVK